MRPVIFKASQLLQQLDMEKTQEARKVLIRREPLFLKTIYTIAAFMLPKLVQHFNKFRELSRYHALVIS